MIFQDANHVAVLIYSILLMQVENLLVVVPFDMAFKSSVHCTDALDTERRVLFSVRRPFTDLSKAICSQLYRVTFVKYLSLFQTPLDICFSALATTNIPHTIYAHLCAYARCFLRWFKVRFIVQSYTPTCGGQIALPEPTFSKFGKIFIFSQY